MFFYSREMAGKGVVQLDKQGDLAQNGNNPN